jgi:FMN phosphatase YigB (HAD superfamily)
MFCTHCYTAFDWKNGDLLEKDRLHNPHYFDHHRHQETIHSFSQHMAHTRDRRQKRKYTEFYHLIVEIRAQCQDRDMGLLWVRHYKKGLRLMQEILSQPSDLDGARIRGFQDDLREVLIDYNEHVADCLQLRGHRLFPNHPVVVCCG